MLRCTQTLILFLALLLTNCMATPTSPVRTSETLTTVTLAVTATPRPAPTATASVTVPAVVTATATATVTATRAPTATPSVTAPQLPTRQPSPAPPAATASAIAAPEAPMVTLTTNANLRAGPGTAYPVIGSARAGQTLVVTGQAAGAVAGRPVTWWRTDRGFVAGSLVTANTAAQTVPVVVDGPLPPEVKVEAKVEPVSTSTSTSASASPRPDLVVLGPDTQYPVRARVVRGWDYEFVDLSEQYDISVYRDVFGMLAHQIDDENIRRYRPDKARIGTYGPLRIVLVDAAPHPDARCPGWGWAVERETYAGDPLGLNVDPCRVQHALAPTGDGAGTTLVSGWGSYAAGATVAVLAAGPGLSDYGTTFLADRLPRPVPLGPAGHPDFSQPLYRPLGVAHREDDRWLWREPFAQIVPAAD